MVTVDEALTNASRLLQAAETISDLAVMAEYRALAEVWTTIASVLVEANAPRD